MVPRGGTQTGRNVKWTHRRCSVHDGPRSTAGVAALPWPAMLLGLLMVSCRLSPVEGNASHQNLAGFPEYLVDGNYQLRLDSPGQGWRLLESKGSNSSVAAPGLCAYDEEQSLLGCVSATRAPSASLNTYADDWLRRLQLSNPTVINREAREFLGQPAEVFEVAGLYLGQPTHVSGVIFFHQNHAYRVLVRGPSDKFDRTRSRRFIDNVHLLPGEVREPILVSTVKRLSGPGWRLVDGVYENAIKNFRMVADSGWSFVVGRELLEFNPDADVASFHEDPEVSLAVRVEPSKMGKSRNVLTERQENHRRNLRVQLLEDKLELQFRGVPQAVRLGRTENGNMVAFCNFRFGNTDIELTSGFSELYRTPALALLARAANGIEVVSRSQRLDFERELMADTVSELSVGRDYALRNGCFHQYSLDFTWCPPRGFWDFTLGDDARVNHGWAVLSARNLQSGLSFQLFARSSTNDESLFQSLVSEHRLRDASTSAKSTFSRVALQRPDAGSEGDMNILYALRQGTDEIAALVSCNGQDLDCRDKSDALVKGFRSEADTNAVDFSDSSFIDRRLGIVQKLPPSYRAKARDDLTMEGGQRAIWESPDSSVTLVTAVSKNADTGVADFLENVDRATRATVPATLLHQKRSWSLKVGGEIAKQQSFVGLNYRFDTVILHHKHVLVAWLVTSRNSNKLPEILSGLRWID